MILKKEQKIFGLPVLKDNIIWLWVNNESVVVVDPAISTPVIKWIKERNMTLDTILQTHHHADHIGGTTELINEWPNVKVVASKREKERIPFQNISVKDNQKLIILEKEFRIMELKGHTKSHIAFYSNDFKTPILFVGDTLFSAGCGRIFEGTHKQMYSSLNKISSLPINTMIYCAHEYTRSNLLWALDIYPEDKLIRKKLLEVERKLSSKELTIPTSLREEMKINLFLRAQNFSEFSYLRTKKDSWS